MLAMEMIFSVSLFKESAALRTAAKFSMLLPSASLEARTPSKPRATFSTASARLRLFFSCEETTCCSASTFRFRTSATCPVEEALSVVASDTLSTTSAMWAEA